jgi:hypothetical protein
MIKKLCLILLLVVGCRDIRKEAGPILNENATVVDLIYSPSHHSRSLDLGLTSGGDLSFTPTSVSIPERHGVVFKCQHGKFYVEDKELWLKLIEGDDVVVEYKELFYVEYENGVEISRELYKMDFLGVAIICHSEIR